MIEEHEQIHEARKMTRWEPLPGGLDSTLDLVLKIDKNKGYF